MPSHRLHERVVEWDACYRNLLAVLYQMNTEGALI
jgi:hypothetical protein